MVSSLLGFLKMQLVPLNHGKRCVDIGCNEGLVSLSIAVNFRPASMLGIDIDTFLVGKAGLYKSNAADP
jgi:tRNA1(Val) A37 N6-methylase TrmN6